MSPLTSRIIVTASADVVWEVVAHRFDRIGDWATAIPSSTAITENATTQIATAEPSVVEAPVAGRSAAPGCAGFRRSPRPSWPTTTLAGR